MDLNGTIAILGALIGLPWLIMHYVTKWKQSPGAMTAEDETLLDELHSLARRLEDRVITVERIAAADSPDFRPSVPDYRSNPENRIADQNQRRN
jgi:phage shock protein B